MQRGLEENIFAHMTASLTYIPLVSPFDARTRVTVVALSIHKAGGSMDCLLVDWAERAPEGGNNVRSEMKNIQLYRRILDPNQTMLAFASRLLERTRDR